MISFFSGFCLENEEELFKNFLDDSSFTVGGFSYGAIKAFRYVLETKERVDKLILISPAFFHEMSKKEKKIQTLFFSKNPKSYRDNFYNNCIYPSTTDLTPFKKEGLKEELIDLLEFVWNTLDLEELQKRNIKLEVYLGEKDKIVDSEKAKEFFQQFGTVYFYKDKGHILI